MAARAQVQADLEHIEIKARQHTAGRDLAHGRQNAIDADDDRTPLGLVERLQRAQRHPVIGRQHRVDAGKIAQELRHHALAVALLEHADG